jgi:hypothetical protein
MVRIVGTGAFNKLKRKVWKPLARREVTYLYVNHAQVGNEFYNHPSLGKIEKLIKRAREEGRPYHILGVESDRNLEEGLREQDEQMDTFVSDARNQYLKQRKQGISERKATEQLFQTILHEHEPFNAGEIVLAAKFDLRLRHLEAYSTEEITRINSLKVPEQEVEKIDTKISQRDLIEAQKLFVSIAEKRGQIDHIRHQRVLDRIPILFSDKQVRGGQWKTRCLAVIGGNHFPLTNMHKQTHPKIPVHSERTFNPLDVDVRAGPLRYSLNRAAVRISAGKKAKPITAWQGIATAVIGSELFKMYGKHPTKKQELVRHRHIAHANKLILRATPSDFETIGQEYKQTQKLLLTIFEDHFSHT